MTKCIGDKNNTFNINGKKLKKTKIKLNKLI